jgi:hypothetical protein
MAKVVIVQRPDGTVSKSQLFLAALQHVQEGALINITKEVPQKSSNVVLPTDEFINDNELSTLLGPLYQDVISTTFPQEDIITDPFMIYAYVRLLGYYILEIVSLSIPLKTIIEGKLSRFALYYLMQHTDLHGVVNYYNNTTVFSPFPNKRFVFKNKKKWTWQDQVIPMEKLDKAVEEEYYRYMLLGWCLPDWLVEYIIPRKNPWFF